jgi:ubiquinone/menaquinone biosynthesis C-methylase UbiE
VSALSFLSQLSQRRRESEWMDAPGVDPATLADSLRFIRRINSALRYTRSTISHLERFSRSWKPGERIRIIDFATGSADVPLAVVRWAARRKFDVTVVGVDLHETTCRLARQATRDEPRVDIVRADVLDLPFDAGSFDYALCSMFLHHLSDADVLSVLKAMDRVARRGIIAADLLRDRRAYAWATLFTLFSNPMVRHDARVSVAQAYSESEAIALRARSGLRYLDYHRHFAHRFVLAGEKLAGGEGGGGKSDKQAASGEETRAVTPT